jgi:hypothetical protein
MKITMLDRHQIKRGYGRQFLAIGAVGLFLLPTGCHTPVDTEKERPLGMIQNLVLEEVDVKIDVEGSSKLPKDLQWFSDLLAASATRELKKAKSFKYYDSELSRRPGDPPKARLSLSYTLSDGSIKDNRTVMNRVEGKIRLVDGTSYLFSESEEVNYQNELNRRAILEKKVLSSAEEFVRQVFEAQLSEGQWLEIVQAEAKNGAKTFLPDPTSKFVGLLEHRIEVARGTQELGWIELAQTADWGKPGQWRAAGSAFLFACGCFLVAAIILGISEKIFGEKVDKQAQPGSLIVFVFGLGGLFFLYLTLAAIF